MNVSIQLLDYKFVLVTLQTSVTITCGIQPTGIVNMAMKVLHNTCICDLPNMNALGQLGFGHTYQANPSQIYYV